MFYHDTSCDCRSQMAPKSAIDICCSFKTLAIVRKDGKRDLPKASQRLLLLKVVASNPQLIAILDGLTLFSRAISSIASQILSWVIMMFFSRFMVVKLMNYSVYKITSFIK